MAQPKFEIVTTTTGVISIRNNEVNEIMHNPVGPWIEANSLYIEQSDFARRLETQDELVLWDVGLGAAANALAALACFDSLKSKGRLRIVSFERDLELLRFALEHSSEFAHFKGYENALAEILAERKHERQGLTWSLRQGDFVQSIEAEETRPHLIFYDPYSPKVNNDMWTTGLFKKIRARARMASEEGTTLYTYSQATRIRAALICAGFYVGYGIPTGLKKDTTEASTDRMQLAHPLTSAWHQTYLRSDSRYPFDCEAGFESSVDQTVAEYFKT